MREESTQLNSKEETPNDESNLGDKILSVELVKASNYSLMGEVISDKYIVIDAIGEGSFAIVYLGQCMDTRESVAIKTLKYSNQDLKDKFVANATTFKDIKHPNIAEILEIDEHKNGQPIVVMKYIEGVSIRQLLDNIGKIDDENTLHSIVGGICSALEYIHMKSLVHGGLTPNQVLISENEVADDFTVTLTDCGTSFLGAEFTCNQSKNLELSYFSPEQTSNEYVAINTDIYSLGIVTYELLTGKHPFARKKLSSLVAGKPEDEPTFIPLTHHSLDLPCLSQLNQLLEQALEKDPDWRMPSVSQFKKELTNWRDKAILEDFDEVDEDFEEIDEDFDEVDEDFSELSGDIDNEFDDSFEDDSIEASSIEKVETPEIKPEKTRKDRSLVKQTKVDSKALVNEKEVASQQENVNFQATPSFYRDLYKETLKDESEKENDTALSEDKTESIVINKDTERSPNQLLEQPKKKQKSLPTESITEEEVKAAITNKGKRRRRRKRTGSTQQNVRTTIRNLVKLRENQGSQEETIAMQFVGKFSDKGPRRSPKATAIRLAVGCLVTALLTGLVMLNLDVIQDAYISGSEIIGKATHKASDDPEPIEEDIEIDDKKAAAVKKSLKVIKATFKGVNQNSSLVSSSTTRLKLKPLEKRTPLASEYYKNWRHHSRQLQNSKIGKRRRIDYKSFNKEWLK